MLVTASVRDRRLRRSASPISPISPLRFHDLSTSTTGTERVPRSRVVTQPRCIVEGDCLLITRRTLRRHFLFRPDAQMRQLYLYALGVSAAKFDIRLHAITLMSNHEHLTVTDPRGQVASFLQELHRLVALGTKVLRGWEGAVWDHCPPSVVRLLTPEAAIEKLAYMRLPTICHGSRGLKPRTV